MEMEKAGMAGSPVANDCPDLYDIMILVVEEDPSYLATITEMLQRHGYHVTGKASLEEGLRALRENPKGFDIVMSVTFTQGPGIDGFELLKHARESHPVVLFADNAPMETIFRAIVGGVCDFMNKPMSENQLCMIWQHVLRWKKLNDEASSDHDAANADGQRIDDFFIPSDGTTRKTGSQGLDGSDEAASNDNQGKSTKKTNFNSSPQQHESGVEAFEKLWGPEAMEIDDQKEGSGDSVPSHCQDKSPCGHTLI